MRVKDAKTWSPLIAYHNRYNAVCLLHNKTENWFFSNLAATGYDQSTTIPLGYHCLNCSGVKEAMAWAPTLAFHHHVFATAATSRHTSGVKEAMAWAPALACFPTE